MSRFGEITYSGNYRLAYVGEDRFLEWRTGNGWKRIHMPLPKHIRGAYAAAKFFSI